VPLVSDTSFKHSIIGLEQFVVMHGLGSTRNVSLITNPYSFILLFCVDLCQLYSLAGSVRRVSLRAVAYVPLASFSLIDFKVELEGSWCLAIIPCQQPDQRNRFEQIPVRLLIPLKLIAPGNHSMSTFGLEKQI
jgi:hypothetical protein